MNRLQKKCVIAIVGTHLLLLTILIVGPAFFNQQPKADNTQVLTFINLVDADVNTGVKNVAQPQPQPIVQPQPTQPQQTQPAPKPVEPTPSLMTKLENYFKPEPKPAPTPQTQEHKIQPNLKPVTRTNVKPIPNPAIKTSLTDLQKKLSKPTEVTLPGNSSAAYASYASAVRSVYDAAWTLPDTIAKDENITVKVTIASDGTVISSRIVTPSGDAPADASVQKTLDRVTFIAPFPEGTTDKQRDYTIVFNPQVKNSE